jgi:hypothetical protein
LEKLMPNIMRWYIVLSFVYDLRIIYSMIMDEKEDRDPLKRGARIKAKDTMIHVAKIIVASC